jgi:thymidylate synthase ThyX
MSKINAEIVGHSLSPQAEELISVLATFPRIILSEVNTHRMLSKNTSSSRAIPFNKMLEAIKTNPFIPIAFQKEHKGMQGTEYITDVLDLRVANREWKDAMNYAILSAQRVTDAGVTKQLANRLLEPFMWTTMLITGSKEGWDNFFRLRCPSYTFHNDEQDDNFVFRSKKDAINHFPETEFVEYESGNVLLKDLSQMQWLQSNQGQAEIHIMDLAEKIWDSVNESTPKQLKAGEWHIPFQDKIDHKDLCDKLPSIIETGDFDTMYEEANKAKVKISVAMAARTSYTVVAGETKVDYEAMISLHDRLLTQDPPHSSPFEHTARAMDSEEYFTFNKGLATNAEDSGDGLIFEGHSQGWCFNLKGFIPYRYLVDNKLDL